MAVPWVARMKMLCDIIWYGTLHRIITDHLCSCTDDCRHVFMKFKFFCTYFWKAFCMQNPEAREKGMTVSLFRRLSEAHPQAVSALQCQYRMCADIMSLCNALIYGNRLRCGSREVATAQLTLSTPLLKHAPQWLHQV